MPQGKNHNVTSTLRTHWLCVSLYPLRQGAWPLGWLVTEKHWCISQNAVWSMLLVARGANSGVSPVPRTMQQEIGEHMSTHRQSKTREDPTNLIRHQHLSRAKAVQMWAYKGNCHHTTQNAITVLSVKEFVRCVTLKLNSCNCGRLLKNGWFPKHLVP